MLLVSTLQPIAELISDELSRKLETTVKIGFRRLQAADIQSRARAFGSMIAAGVDEQTAMAVSGFGVLGRSTYHAAKSLWGERAAIQAFR